MRLLLHIASACTLAVSAIPAFGAPKPETPHLAFVAEYIRELAAIENIRASGGVALKGSTENQVFLEAIHSSTSLQLELRSQIRILKGMRLNTPFDQLIPDLTGFYQEKVVCYQKMIDIGSTFLSAPKPGIDYGKLAAEMPKIRAQLEYIDRSLFDAVPLIFATLIDQKADSKGHASHLTITKAERAKLVDDLTDNFGAKLDQKDQDFTVGAASVLRAYFLKDFRCSDEPWE